MIFPSLNLSRTCLTLCLLVTAGCGGASVPTDKQPRFKVEGTVKFNGEPTQGVALSFSPRGTTVGQGGWGVTDEQGKYFITDYNSKIGLQSGDYYVTFSKRTMADGSPIPAGKVLDNSTPTVESLPRAITTVQNQHNHPYYLDIKADKTDADFDLKIPKK